MHAFRITDYQIVLSEEHAAPQARRRYKKSTNGCIACKRRKVKVCAIQGLSTGECDEVRPVCSNCSLHFRGVQTCEWPPAESKLLQPNGSNVVPPNMPASLLSPIPPAENNGRGKRVSPSASSSISITSNILSSTIDPFGSLPPTLVPKAQELLHHYISVAAWEYFPAPRWKRALNPLVASWSTLAGADSLLFHCILQASARSLERREGIKWSVYSEFVAKECIRLLRDRVQDPVLGISNPTLGAIAQMLEIEYDKGNHRAVKMHLGGLISIIKLRGGLDSIRSSCALTMTAIIWRTLLITNFCPFQPATANPSWIQTMLPPISSKVYLPSAADLQIDKATWDGLAIIKFHTERISRTLQMGDKPDPTSTEALAALFWQRYTYLTPEYTQPFSDAIRILTILFLCISNPDSRTSLFDHPLGAQSAQKIVASLRAALESASDSHSGRGRSDPASALLVWSFVVGAVAAREMVEREWFVEGLRRVAHISGLCEWAEVKGLLVGIVWLELWHDELGERVWEEARMGNFGDASCVLGGRIEENE